jgi:hypothetical protein
MVMICREVGRRGYELVAGSLGHPGVARGTNAQQLHRLGVLDSKAQQLVGGGK